MLRKIILFISFSAIFYSNSYAIPTLRFLCLNKLVEQVNLKKIPEKTVVSIIPSDLHDYFLLMLDVYGTKNPLTLKLMDDLISRSETLENPLLALKAAKLGFISLLRLLFFSKGVSIDIKDQIGFTSLMHAVNFNQKATVNFLLGSGASAGERNINGHTALDCAKLHRNQELIAIIEQALSCKGPYVKIKKLFEHMRAFKS